MFGLPNPTWCLSCQRGPFFRRAPMNGTETCLKSRGGAGQSLPGMSRPGTKRMSTCPSSTLALNRSIRTTRFPWTAWIASGPCQSHRRGNRKGLHLEPFVCARVCLCWCKLCRQLERNITTRFGSESSFLKAARRTTSPWRGNLRRLQVQTLRLVSAKGLPVCILP